MDLNLISAIVFYVVIFLLILVYRKRFIVQNKIIFLLRTKLGLKLMDRIAKKYPRFLKFLGSVGIVVGFLGMIFMVATLVIALVKFILDPSTPSPVAPLIPGVRIPGSPVFVPFWYGIIALFVTVVIHEFSHGVMSRVHKIDVDSSGVGMMAVLPLAFVEPNEKQLQKASRRAQLSIFAAGPFANILTAVVLLLLLFPLGSLFAVEEMVDFNGVYFDSVQDGFPAAEAGVLPGVVYNSLNGEPVGHIGDLTNLLSNLSSGDVIVLSGDELSHSIIAGSHPNNFSKAYLGVVGIESSFEIKSDANTFVFYAKLILEKLVLWMFFISLGLGLANLLPIGPVDGGKMLFTAFDGVSKKNPVHVVIKYVGLFLLLVILFLLLPIISASAKAIFGWLFSFF